MIIPVWPICLLNPMETPANPVAFTRGGGKSINGIERVIKTDRGYWAISLIQVSVRSQAEKQAWNGIRSMLGGRAGLIAVPVKSWDSAPYSSQANAGNAPVFEKRIKTQHGPDETTFSDGTMYDQGAVDIVMHSAASIGETVVNLRLVKGFNRLSGIRFSYNHALYETGEALDINNGGDGPIWKVTVFPSIRAPIPANTPLEVELPTCLCHLADDRSMDIAEGKRLWTEADVSFVEAVDHWNDIAGVPLWP